MYRLIFRNNKIYMMNLFLKNKKKNKKFFKT